MLVPVMLNKLPQELRLVISRKFERDLWDFDLFIQVFREELEARERCESIGVSSSENHRIFQLQLLYYLQETTS